MNNLTWNRAWREDLWSGLDQTWDVIIIGGGITGAGILHEAVHQGFRTLLVEGKDFASGTSSRSSKLVHGGFRYLKNAQLKMTLESVHERERLLREGRGLINQLGFLLACYQGDSIPTWVFGAGLAVYDLLGLKWQHRYYEADALHALCPFLRQDRLEGGYRFFDAQTDDARLVIRLLREAVRAGGAVLNYAPAVDLLRSRTGRICGVTIEDRSDSQIRRSLELRAPVIISAAGAWADELRSMVGAAPRLRKLRGSHLILPLDRFPLTRAVSFLHPGDHRPVTATPWEGAVIFGTTDVDHSQPLETDVATSGDEAEYLLDALTVIFPQLELTAEDIQATFAGIRPVINTGKANPSQESREHILWNENGLLTIAGGKLTTFRLMARDALRSAARLLNKPLNPKRKQRALDSTSGQDSSLADLPAPIGLRLSGRYGAEAVELMHTTHSEDLAPVGNLTTQWAELRWAARTEGVVHLDDLLLRRVRLGLLLPKGGLNVFDRIREIVQDELGWDRARWEEEAQAYQALWLRSYSPPHAQIESRAL